MEKEERLDNLAKELTKEFDEHTLKFLLENSDAVKNGGRSFMFGAGDLEPKETLKFTGRYGTFKKQCSDISTPTRLAERGLRDMFKRGDHSTILVTEDSEVIRELIKIMRRNGFTNITTRQEMLDEMADAGLVGNAKVPDDEVQYTSLEEQTSKTLDMDKLSFKSNLSTMEENYLKPFVHLEKFIVRDAVAVAKEFECDKAFNDLMEGEYNDKDKKQ